jgi:hypothetical protein
LRLQVVVYKVLCSARLSERVAAPRLALFPTSSMPTLISSPLQTFSLVSCPSRARAPVVVLCEWLARGRSAMPLREGAGRCERRWPRRRRRRRWVGRLRPSAAQASIIVRPGAARWERTQLTRSLPPSQPVGQREALARADTSKAASKADQSRGRQRTRGGRRRGGCLPNMQRPPALTGQRSMSRVELVSWPTMCSKGSAHSLLRFGDGMSVRVSGREGPSVDDAYAARSL